jgi:hypothetical protein
MRAYPRWFTLAAGLALAAPLAAQATNDEARLIIGIGGGWMGGSDLWTVTNQPVITGSGATDQFLLVRDVRGNINLTGQLTFFPRPNWGWTGEITYLGLGTNDGCRIAVDNGDLVNRDACGAINGRERAASAIAAMGGVVYRPSPRGDVQPYVRANAGIALVPRSTTAMVAFFGQNDEFALPIYSEDDSKAVKPIGALSLGLSTAPSSGYQFRIEARATAVQLVAVTGASALGDFFPPTAAKWVLVPSLIVAFDVVLEKRRGRRY